MRVSRFEALGGPGRYQAYKGIMKVLPKEIIMALLEKVPHEWAV